MADCPGFTERPARSIGATPGNEREPEPGTYDRVTCVRHVGAGADLAIAHLVAEGCGVTQASLERFVQAQEPVIERVLAELRSGRKTSHWMWFVFPQIQGLGHSPTARHFAIASRAEAEAYLRHPVLGPRLRECTHLVNAVEGGSIEEIFGYPDYLKFRSCMTLFANVTADNQVFIDALGKYFGGEHDPATLERL